ncbi:MAG: hypothetical protein IPJ54_08290 [Saprospiraceae bacterium]|nr:hypothetical protein [Saprospiraceae bacterium]
MIKHLNTKLTNWGTNQSFLEMIEYGITLHPDGKNFGLHNRIAGVFELLDMLGYWKDKETNTSNYARLGMQTTVFLLLVATILFQMIREHDIKQKLFIVFITRTLK